MKPHTNHPSSKEVEKGKKSENKEPAYTKQEKRWLVKQYGGEFNFLQLQGLELGNDEDHAEGRRIARAIIASEGEGDVDDDDEEEAEAEEDEDYDDGELGDNGSEANSLLDEIENDPTSHMADYAFSSEELAWIKKNFQHSGNFLICYGLKPYKDGDCEEGKMIVKALMEDESEDEEDSEGGHESDLETRLKDLELNAVS